MEATPGQVPVRRRAEITEEALARVPGYGGFMALGDIGALAVRTVRVAFTPPFGWGRDAVVEMSLAFRRCVVPLAISLSAYIIAYALIVFAALLHALGAVDRLPGGVFVASIREISVWVTTMIFAGVAGAAATSDLGARKVREELDALATLGVDSFRTLVVPRVVAMTLAAPVLGVIGLIIVQVVNFGLGPTMNHYPRGIFVASLAHNLLPLDVAAFLLKLAIIGFFAGVVSCQKGLATEGGAEGVGRAVNETVVISFFGIWLITTVFNLAFLTLFPQTAVLRG